MWLISLDLTASVSIHSAIAKTISVNQGVQVILGCTYFLWIYTYLVELLTLMAVLTLPLEEPLYYAKKWYVNLFLYLWVSHSLYIHPHSRNLEVSAHFLQPLWWVRQHLHFLGSYSYWSPFLIDFLILCTSSFDKCLFRSLAWLQMDYCYYFCCWVLYILDMSALLDEFSPTILVAQSLL